MTINPLLLALAVGLNLTAAAAAYAKRAVSASGAVGGLVVGALTLYTGGFLFWITLMLFFGSSTVASRVGGDLKERLSRVHEKGSRRDVVQVVANAGVPVAALVLLSISRNPWLAIAAASAFASANADTWASEIGILSRRRPRSVLTRAELEPGTSGGTTSLGTAAAGVGSLVIALWFAAGLMIAGLVGSAAWWQGHAVLPEEIGAAAGAVFLAGLVGSLVDSILGATVQGQFVGPDGAYTERRTTKTDDGAVRNRRVRGIQFITNDAVNFLTSAIAAVLGPLLLSVIN